MTENDMSLLREMSAIREQFGEMKADTRTLKHDVANIQQGMQAIGNRLTNLNSRQERGLSFFAGMAFVVTSCGGLLLAVWKLLGGHG